MNIVKVQKPKGVVVQFGGQTAINLADKLAKILVLKYLVLSRKSKSC